MIQFELDVDKSTIRVIGDSTAVCSEFSIYSIPTDWCINYLRNYTYQSVYQLINGRKQSCLHVDYLDKLPDCENLEQQNELAYKREDWVDTYLKILRYELLKISPSDSSRYFKNFHAKRNELIDTLVHYSSNVPMYRKVNVAGQTKLKLY